MKSECRIVRRAVLLGEVGSAEAQDHLRDCEACRAFERAERVVARLVRDRAAREPAPHALRERLVVALEAERRRSRHWWTRWPLLSKGAAAALLLAAISGGIYWLQGVAKAERMVEAVAADHLELASRGAALFTAPSSQEMGDWVRSKLKLAVKVPVLPQATLIGARQCRLRGRPAALIVYRLSGPSAGATTASLFVFRSSGERWSQMDTLKGSSSKRICHGHDRGLSVLIWEDRTVTYALVTELPEAQLEEFAKYL